MHSHLQSIILLTGFLKNNCHGLNHTPGPARCSPAAFASKKSTQELLHFPLNLAPYLHKPLWRVSLEPEHEHGLRV